LLLNIAVIETGLLADNPDRYSADNLFVSRLIANLTRGLDVED
jgi:hypothetical protein